MYIAVIVIVSLFFIYSFGIYIYEKILERPSYSVLEKRPGYETRIYESYITAEVEVSGGYERASTDGFGLLAGYIFGGNTKADRVAMTAPVTMTRNKGSEKIAMTAPVLMQAKEEDKDVKYTMSFMMPSSYTLDTLPKPNNPAVKLRKVGGKKIAAIRFSLNATASRVEKKTEALESALVRDGLTAVSGPQIARYNAPFSNPLLRRNEILIEIE